MQLVPVQPACWVASMTARLHGTDDCGGGAVDGGKQRCA